MGRVEITIILKGIEFLFITLNTESFFAPGVIFQLPCVFKSSWYPRALEMIHTVSCNTPLSPSDFVEAGGFCYKS